jgi:hypothetical protein
MEESQVAGEGGKPERSSYDKAIIAEDKFSQYLDDHKIPFMHIYQSKESFSDEFNERRISRPDYIVQTMKGVFYIDVKYRDREKQPFGSENKTRFCLDHGIIKRLFNLQNDFHSTVWLAFTDDENSLNYHYASISEVYDFFIFISENIRKNYYEDYKLYFIDSHNCLIFIPDYLFYDGLSYENGFFKKPEQNLLETEAKAHIDKAKERALEKQKRRDHSNSQGCI